MTSYNPSQLEKMQKEAYERVSQMHKRSQEMVGSSQQSPTKEPSVEKPAPTSSSDNKTHQQNGLNDILSTLFPQSNNLSNMWDFKIDEEKALIGIIIYILAKNKADPKLLIGLGYLLL